VDVGAPELILVLVVCVLLFGAKKLPELARGSGRALRIFRAETMGLADDEDEKDLAQESLTRESTFRTAKVQEPLRDADRG